MFLMNEYPRQIANTNDKLIGCVCVRDGLAVGDCVTGATVQSTC